ncbi:MAG: hypothetical protein GXP14_14640 [Gammaproteobacteria bacterium]|nr:hypothetical protein [Gammaproteobacteria bacterium]
MMLRVLPFILLLLSFSAAGEEQAEETPQWFQFEIIIFEYSDEKGLYSELWSEDPELADYSSAQELLPLTVLPLFAKPHSFDEDILQDLSLEEGNTVARQAETQFVDFPAPSLDIQPSLTKKAQPERPFMLLEKADRSLNEIATQFKLKSKYKLLFHQAWRQPVAKHGEATAIRISSLTSNLDHLLGVYERDKDTSSSIENESIILVAPKLEIDGLIIPSLNRYLHLDLQLSYRKLLPIETTEHDAMNDIQNEFLQRPLARDEISDNVNNIVAYRDQDFSLKTTRRMRSKQLHYFDHPLFGVLALITPYKRAVDTEIPKDDNETLVFP